MVLSRALTLLPWLPTPVRSAVLKPAAATVTGEAPGLISVSLDAPPDLDTASYTVPVSTPVTVMAALETSAPELSRMAPASVPRSDCATAVPTRTKLRNPTRSPHHEDRCSLRILAPPEIRDYVSTPIRRTRGLVSRTRTLLSSSRELNLRRAELPSAARSVACTCTVGLDGDATPSHRSLSRIK